MGCGGSKQRAEIGAVSDLSKFDKWTRFEMQFPFYRMYIDTFETRVKRYVLNKPSVTLVQL